MIPTESDMPLHGWAPYSDMHRERIRAHKKHGEKSMEGIKPLDPRALRIVVEEIGEVARVLNEHDLGNLADPLTPLRAELVQCGAMIAAWIDNIDDVRHLVIYPHEGF